MLSICQEDQSGAYIIIRQKSILTLHDEFEIIYLCQKQILHQQIKGSQALSGL